jgi:hypothetical protein
MLLTFVQFQNIFFRDFFIELSYILVNNCIIIVANFRILYLEMVPLQKYQFV